MAVEMALAGSVFVMLLLGAVEFGRYHFASESLRYVVGELARAVTVDPDRDWSTEKAAYVRRSPILELADFETLDVLVTRAAAPMPTAVRITAVYPYRFSLPWLSAFNRSISNDIRFSVVVP